MHAMPFQPDVLLAKLASLHPDPASFQAAVGPVSRQSRESVVRLWLTEGTPFAFRGCPAVYEEVRRWLGQRLNVCPKQITLVGSGRIGFSLAPAPDYGRPFGSDSDLDLSIVSERLFSELSSAFDRWESDYQTGRITPRNATERRYWDANLGLGREMLRRSFFDVRKLPNRDPYPVVQRVSQSMWILIKRLEVTPSVETPRSASVRVYRS